MRVAIVTGIWPPDVGGPAVHAPALASFLLARGHHPEVVTTAASEPAPAGFPVHWVPRSRPVGIRHALVVLEVARVARTVDVVYATSMIRRAAIGAALARRPLVVKLVADEAYERARRSGIFSGTLEDFQQVDAGVRVRALRWTRTAALRRAAHVFCPSRYLRDVALGWGISAERVTVVPNPAPVVGDLPPREILRREYGMSGIAVAFAGRLTPQKDLGVALEAIAAVPGVQFYVLGDGPEETTVRARIASLGLAERVRLLGGGSRTDVLRLFRAADCSLLSSSWENFPHTVVEALAVGTPVIATSVGGVPEIIRDGENGLLVAPRDAAALAATLGRFCSDPSLRERLAAAASASVAELAPDRLLQIVEDTLQETVDLS